MAIECNDNSIPRACADAFQKSAERMSSLETKADSTAVDIQAIKSDVGEIKTLLSQARGGAVVGKTIAAVIWAVAGALAAWLFKKN